SCGQPRAFIHMVSDTKASVLAGQGSNEQAAGGDAEQAGAHAPAGFFALALGSIGVVYGDIGTSPLYALREAVHAVSGGISGGAWPIARETIIGVLSLILWSLILVVTIKYVVILLR